MHKIDLKIVIHFYTNASEFIVKFIIIQFQLASRIDVLIIITKINALLQKTFNIIMFKIISKLIATKKNIKKNIKIFILYDSFIFNFI